MGPKPLVSKKVLSTGLIHSYTRTSVSRSRSPNVANEPGSSSLFVVRLTSMWLLSSCTETEWPKSPRKLKMLGKNSLINLFRKFQLGYHTCSITILRKTTLKIPNCFKIKKMSDPLSKHHILEQQAFIVEHYFRSKSYRTTLWLYKEWFHDTADVRTMKWIIEWFQMDNTVANAPNLGRPHALRQQSN